MKFSRLLAVISLCWLGVAGSFVFGQTLPLPDALTLSVDTDGDAVDETTLNLQKVSMRHPALSFYRFKVAKIENSGSHTMVAIVARICIIRLWIVK